MRPPQDPSRVEPSLRRLKVFDAVVRCGTISRAATEIGLAQPSVTLALAKLESEVGESLLMRGPGGTSPTPAGLILHRRVERMLRKIHSAAARLFDAQDAHKAAMVVRNLTGAQARDHLAVDAAGSFRAAAAQLGLAEPTLNRSLRQLREMAGTPLYQRTPLGFATTAAGARFASELRVALSEIDQALDELAAARGATNSRLLIGCLHLMPKLFVAEAVNAVIRRFGRVEISLQEDAYKPMAKSLRDGAVDVVVGALRGKRSGEFKQVPLFTDPYVLVVREGHPLLSGDKLQDKQLAEMSWIVPWRDTPRRAVVEAMFARLPRRPHVAIETSSLTMTEAALAETDGITLLCQSQVEMEDSNRQLRILRTYDSSGPRTVGIISRRDWLPTPVQGAFIEQLVANGRRRSQKSAKPL
jgi:DNA-binding transcriptional LysR family regulator